MLPSVASIDPVLYPREMLANPLSADRVSNRFVTLDAMRGVAAILVVLYHLQIQRGQPQVRGFLAVDLFFALSGFVIALNYEPKLSRGLGPVRFLQLRIVRLYPLFFLGLALGMLGEGARQVFGMRSALPAGQLAVAIGLNSLMLPTVHAGPLFPLNPPSWSLFFELVVNGVFAVALWRLRSRLLVLISAVALACIVAMVRAPYLLDAGWSWFNAGLGLTRAMFSFPVGILLFRHMGSRPRGRSASAFVLFAALIGTFVLPVPHAFEAAYQILAMAIAFPLVLMLGIRLELPVYAQRFGGLLGDLSYPIYVIHWPLMPLRPLITRVVSNPMLGDAIHLALIVGLGFCAARYFDKPARAWLGRRVGTTRGPG